MVDLILNYGGFLGILLAIYGVSELRKKPTSEDPNPNNLAVYIIMVLGAILNYYVFPYVLLFAIQCITTIVVGVFGAFAIFTPILIGIAIFAFVYRIFK